MPEGEGLIRFAHPERRLRLIGTHEFTKAMVREHGHAARRGGQLAGEIRTAQEAVWQETLQELLRKRRKTAADVAAEGKSVEWKLALAAAMKERTTATNRWLGTALHMGNLHEVSRKVAAWPREPDRRLRREPQNPPNPKASPGVGDDCLCRLIMKVGWIS